MTSYELINLQLTLTESLKKSCVKVYFHYVVINKSNDRSRGTGIILQLGNYGIYDAFACMQWIDINVMLFCKTNNGRYKLSHIHLNGLSFSIKR